MFSQTKSQNKNPQKKKKTKNKKETQKKRKNDWKRSDCSETVSDKGEGRLTKRETLLKRTPLETRVTKGREETGVT